MPEPARRQPADDAAEGHRRPGLRGRTGQPGGRRPVEPRADGSKVTINIPSSGRVPGGATVERSVATPFGEDAMLTLNLKDGDFTTVQRVTDAINKAIGGGTAFAVDATSVKVNAPKDIGQRSVSCR